MGTVIDLVEHPASLAWRKLAPKVAEPTAIETLRNREKATVYRLGGVGLGGSAVVAKHCRTSGVLIERAVYEQLLPQLPVTALHYYGCTSDDDGSCWLFLEDAGGTFLSPALEWHRELAARWLALLHTSAARFASAAPLPVRGAGHYLEHLRSARLAILRSASDAAMQPTELVMLEHIVRQCDVIESRWHEVEEWCAGIPATLVHGDFRSKNVQVRSDTLGARLFAMDWEMAGWGVPAADLAVLRGVQGDSSGLTTYLTHASSTWPNLSARSVVRAADAGKLFRRLAAVSWCSLSLSSRWGKSVAHLQVHEAALHAAIEGAKWAR
jgi:hypothetical protein